MNRALEKIGGYCHLSSFILARWLPGLLVCLIAFPDLSMAHTASASSASSVKFAASGNAAMDVVRASALNAQARCNDLGHDNMDEYVSCTDALFQEVKGTSAKALQKRLGILYFGWLGAERWQRVGLPGADEAAKHYFWRFRPLQQKLVFSDQDLCVVLDGDCTVRLAQVAMALKEYGPVAPPAGKRAGASSAKVKARGISEN